MVGNHVRHIYDNQETNNHNHNSTPDHLASDNHAHNFEAYDYIMADDDNLYKHERHIDRNANRRAYNSDETLRTREILSGYHELQCLL